jgi:Tfp pilus assembly protein PilO
MAISEELLEIKEEWKSFKKLLFHLLIAAVLAVLSYGFWIGAIETRVSRNETDILENDKRSAINENRLNAIEITNSSTNARLTSIDIVLQEIKLAINKLK